MANDDDGYSVMQAQLGLMGSRGSMSPLGIATPMPSMMPVRHPGEVARDMVQQTQTSAMQTMQTAAMVNQGAGWGLGNFARQYQQNMMGIQQQQLNPWAAGATASMMGMGGYQPGMMPSPVQMTAPSMGIYRPPPPMPMATVPPVPPMPMFPSPFQAQAPSPMFSTPFDRNQVMADYRGMQHTALGLSLPGVAGRIGADVLGSRMGAGLGAMMGARFGGVPGAAIGSTVGAIGGLLGTDHFLGRGVQHMVDDMNPLARMARHSAQIRGMTQDFVVGGPNMSPTGRGLSTGASTHLARSLHDIAGQSSFQRETGGMFSSQDLMRITQVSGQQGLLDMAQRPDQISGQVKNIAKALKSFMQIASEPDVTEALKQLGQMRTMGLSLGESMLAVQQAKSFARAAGTSVRGVMEAGGLPGAMVFQQQGLSAGLGMQVGMGSLGMARQAVAGGTYTPQQLAMLGGTQGIAQRNMEMSAALLKQPLMTAAMTGYGAGGTFGLNAEAMGGLARGQFGIQQMAGMGVSNMMDAVRQGGVGALAAFQMQQPELQDQVGRALGPAGIKMVGFQQIMQTQKLLGLKGPGGSFAAAKALGMTDDQARQNVLEMNSPEFFQNQQRQILMTRQDERAMARERWRATAPTLMDKVAQSSETVRGAATELSDLSTGFGDVLEGGVNFFQERGQSAAARRLGQTRRRTPRELLASSPLEARMIASMSHADMVRSGALGAQGARDTAIFRTPGGDAIGHSETLANIRGTVWGGNADDLRQMRQAEGGLGAVLGGGGMETVARTLTGGTGFANEEEVRRRALNMQKGGESVMRGLGASVTTQKKAYAQLTSAFKDKAGDVMTAYEEALAAKAKEKSSLFGDAALSEDDMQDVMRTVQSQTGVPMAELQKYRKDLETTSMQGARDRAGAKGAGGFTAHDITDEAGYKGRVDALRGQQRDIGQRLVGGKTAFREGGVSGGILGGLVFGLPGAIAGAVMGTRGADTRRTETLSLLFGSDKDKRVGTLAALKAAEAAGVPGAGKRLSEYKKKLGADAFELEKRARTLVTKAGDKKDVLAQVGQTYSQQSLDEMEKSAEAAGAEYLGGKKMLLEEAGLATFADKSMLAELGAGDHLEQLLEKGGEGLTGPMADLAKQYAAAPDDTAKAAILEKASQRAQQAGAVSEAETVGGQKFADVEQRATIDAQRAAETGAEAAANFPDAVNTFQAASLALERAAEHLGKATNLEAGSNDGWWPL